VIGVKEDLKPKYDWSAFSNLSPDEIEEKAKEILNEMTLDEKLKQMVGRYTMGQALRSVLKKSERSRFYSMINQQSGIPRLCVPPMIFSDGPRGVGGRIKSIRKPTCFPVATARAASFDLDLQERVASAIGTEMRVHGNNLYGGVCINQLYHPRGGRAQEAYGEDTYLLGEMGAALVRGIQKHKVMACAKHYAVNNQETTRFKLDVTVDERTLREVFLPHFKKCVDAGATSIMAAYNLVNGVQCGHHTHLLRDILKNEWGFKGFVVSDWLFCVRDGKEAILGGMDLEMPWERRMKRKKMRALVESGEIPEELIDDSVLRILRAKLSFALPGRDEKNYPAELSACDDHIQLALEAARKGTVLLENNDNFLPLKRSEIKKIGVFGEYAAKWIIGDRGSSIVNPEYTVTAFKGIKKAAGDGIEVVTDDASKLEKLLEIASSLDVVVIVAGFHHKDEGEGGLTILGRELLGGDRDFMTLKPKDIVLIEEVAKINPNVIVVMHSGGSIITEGWREKVKAILMWWYGGMEGGTALGEILFGDVNPSAKCPCTFPKSEDQLPPFDKNATKDTYGYYHGYRYTDKYKHEPRYPFGYGLSYTTYAYDNLNLDKSEITTKGEIIISVDVKNTGKIAGEEIVQVYVGAQNSKVERHVKELKRFTRVSLNPGKQKTVTFNLPAQELVYYDVDKKSWVVEPLTYKVYVGTSSAAKDLIEAEFKVK